MNKFKQNNSRTVLYLRLSDEDRNKLTKEQVSESIKNQELMLKDYCKEKEWNVIGVYNDEDYSGADKNRPNFNKMISECEKGNVDIVLVKTQARFARDIELIDKYIHNKFKEWNIRFVTYIEKIDTMKRETKKTSQITAMTDEWYIEDTSLNIRETFRAKRENGEFTGSFAPYGYIKDPENKNHLIIDSSASFIVKRIYDEYISGKGLGKIANNLNQDGILSPLEYKYYNGSKLQIPLIKNHANYEYIEKTGIYKIDISFINNRKEVLKNIILYNFITTDRIKFNNKCKIILKKYAEKKVQIYYTTQKEIDIEHFIIQNWTIINENGVFPQNTTCIAAVISSLDRTHTINYQLEIVLKENLKHERFYLDIIPKANNHDIKLDLNIIIRKKYQWSQQTIKKILTDEVYIGNLVQFKTTYVSYKNHALIHNSKSEWIRAYKTHESIIDKNVWHDVQKRLQEKSRSCKTGTIHAFANKVFCMECNKIFFKCGKKDKTGFSYLCCKDKIQKWTNCSNKKYIKEKELYDFVLEKINDLLNNFYNESQLEDIKGQEVETKLFKEKLDFLDKELNDMSKELENKNLYFQRLYEDRINNIVDDNEYMILKSKYKDDYNRIEERINNIKNEINTIGKKQQILINNHNIFKKYSYINSLDIEIINNFIDKIFIGKYNSNNEAREIKIIWDFTL